MSDPNKQLEEAKRQRSQASLLWKVFGLLCFVCLLEIPLPPLVPWMAFAGAALSGGAAGHFFFQATKMPTREALLLAQTKEGTLSASMLCIELSLDPTTAKVLLHTMEKQGLLQLDEDTLYDKNDMIYRLKGLPGA